MNWKQLYLGGVVGYALCMLGNPGIRRGLAVGPYRQYTYLLIVVSILLWPLTLLFQLTLGSAFYRWWSKAFYLTREAKCAVCGVVGEVHAPKVAPSSVNLPMTWHIDREHRLTCSIACAQHLHECHRHGEVEIH